jgi:hypothetical protein
MLSRPFAQRGLAIRIGRSPGTVAIVDHEQGIPLPIRAVLCKQRGKKPSSRQPRGHARFQIRWPY